MAANTLPIFIDAVENFAPQTFASGDTTTKKTVATGNADGSRIDSVMCSTDDTTTVNLAFYLSDGTTDFHIGNVNLPIGSGYTTVARVEAMATLAPSLGYLTLKNASWSLKCNCVATMTAAKVTTVVAMGGNY